MKKHCYSILILLSFFVGCGNTEDKQYVEPEYSSPSEKVLNVECLEQECSSHDECLCGADICIPEMAGMDPNISSSIE